MKLATWAVLSLLGATVGCATASGDQGGDNSGGGSGGAASSDAGSSSDDGSSSSSQNGAEGGSTSDGGTSGNPGNDPFTAAAKCTSMKMWTGGTTGSADMEPGMACASCHTIGGKATKAPFDIAGTVYPSAHEPDLCNGDSTATIIITDAKGADHMFTANAAGNFYNKSFLGVGGIAMPYKAKVMVGGKTRAMVASQMNGDCNSCHTQTGTMSAPGRILLP
jgi:hypothetical protein